MRTDSARQGVAPVAATAWHAATAVVVLAALQSRADGLTTREVHDRQGRFGPNEVAAAERGSAWRVLGNQFQNVLIVVLLVATALSAALGHAVEAVAITAIVAFAVGLGFVQELRAERALLALRQLAAPLAVVRRDGVEVEVPARELVPGDVLQLRAGDRLAADARLLEAVNLLVDEAPLTGESTPVAKRAEPACAASAALADHEVMVHAGTAISSGRGRAVVVATAMATELGRIAGMLQAVEPLRTPLQQNLDRLGRQLARAALVVVALIVALGLLRGQPFVELLVFGIALAVAVVPEALPAVVTVSLAIGVRRLATRRALMRRLPAVETLGSTTIICSDKTGTLTRDEMTVRVLHVAGRSIEVTGVGYEPEGRFVVDGAAIEPEATLREFLTAAVLCGDAHIEHDAATGRWRVKGDPTEGALVVAASKAGLQQDEITRRCPRLAEIPFSSEAKRMVTLHHVAGGTVAYAKGAPEVVLAACTHVRTGHGDVELQADARQHLLEVAREMAGRALRVLAVARREVDTLAAAGGGLTWLGLAGMIDPPRDEARAALDVCRRAGIEVVMITGDHPVTAEAVARELGLLAGAAAPQHRHRVLTGAELDALDDGALRRVLPDVAVFARVSPAHKLRLVSALQAAGHVVAMTGDGVNDAPALKQADIGVAMGITGTAVAREAAAMTLTDDDFASIVAAVEQGRAVFANIRKYLMFLLSSNIGEIGLMATASLLGLPLPLTAVQILYVNLATDGLPALALSVDPPAADLMRRPPRQHGRGVLTRPVVGLMVLAGAWSTLANVTLFAWALHSGRPLAEAMTLTFVALVLIQFVKAFVFRSERESTLHRPFANRWLDLAITWEIVLLVVIVQAPALHEAFGTRALHGRDWLLAAGTAATILPVLEVAKAVLRRSGRHC
ncbi:MAG: cation-translocating P-type ATPase [Planctomycetes bacterium]|nr:cation-translocating P-type ATPase [Planctomycetota bacterium]